MLPSMIIKLDQSCFSHDAAMCTGPQVAAVISAVGEVFGPLSWFVADLDYVGTSALPRTPGGEARVIGSGDRLPEMVAGVDQLLSGVFFGVFPMVKEPRLREAWTEDEEGADLCDAIVEIRAFDTTHIEIAGVDGEAIRKVGARFQQNL